MIAVISKSLALLLIKGTLDVTVRTVRVNSDDGAKYRKLVGDTAAAAAAAANSAAVLVIVLVGALVGAPEFL
jgi:hypothetical protein